MSEQVLTRRLLNWKPRNVDFRYIDGGELVDELDLAAAWKVDTLYLIDTADVSDKWLSAPLDHGWTARPFINESDAERGRHVHVGYHWGEHTVTVRNASAWFQGIELRQMHRAAYDRLTRDLQRVFDDKAQIVSTPGRTGLDLLERSLPRNGVRYERIDDQALEMIYSNCGQGRLEVFPHDDTLHDGLYCLDGRWMYAACCNHLPTGKAVHDWRNENPGHVTGFIQADCKVPNDWNHIGLLPRLIGDNERPHRDYPRTPGEWFTGWFTTAEAALAFEHGWIKRVTERWLWPTPTTDPAAQWMRKLRGLRAEYEASSDELAPVLAGTIRRIHLQAVGTWFRHEGLEYGRVARSEAQQVPVGAKVVYRDGTIIYTAPTTLSDAQARFQHPEWAATVWGRARARLAARALEVPFDSIVSLRTDALWLDENIAWLYGWEDDGKVGTFRLKDRIPGPIQAPRDEQEMRELLALRG